MSPYRVSCSCGASVTGTRLPRHQVVTCPGCRQPVFVLPESPWQEETAAEKLIPLVPSAGSSFRSRRWSLIGSGVALIIVGVIFTFLVWPGRQSPDGDEALRAKGAGLSEVLARGQKLLSEGQFRLAQQQLENADWTQLAPQARQAWRQTFRQAALLADLSPEPLEEILRHARRVPHEEWLAEFARRYQDKAMVFDAEFQRLPGTGWTTDYHLGDGPDGPRLVFDNLRALGRLPVGESQRLLLGVRLAAIRLEPPGPQWVVRFLPDSGVFLTDRSAVALLVPALNGPEADELLRRQAHWAESDSVP